MLTIIYERSFLRIFFLQKARLKVIGQSMAIKSTSNMTRRTEDGGDGKAKLVQEF